MLAQANQSGYGTHEDFATKFHFTLLIAYIGIDFMSYAIGDLTGFKKSVREPFKSFKQILFVHLPSTLVIQWTRPTRPRCGTRLFDRSRQHPRVSCRQQQQYPAAILLLRTQRSMLPIPNHQLTKPTPFPDHQPITPTRLIMESTGIPTPRHTTSRTPTPATRDKPLPTTEHSHCLHADKHVRIAIYLSRTLTDLRMPSLSTLLTSLILTPAFLDPFTAYRDAFLLHPKHNALHAKKGEEKMGVLYPYIKRQLQNARSLRTYRLGADAGARSHNVRLYTSLLSNLGREGQALAYVKRDDDEGVEGLRRACGDLWGLVRYVRIEYVHGHGVVMGEIEEVRPCRWLNWGWREGTGEIGSSGDEDGEVDEEEEEGDDDRSEYEDVGGVKLSDEDDAESSEMSVEEQGDGKKGLEEEEESQEEEDDEDVGSDRAYAPPSSYLKNTAPRQDVYYQGFTDSEPEYESEDDSQTGLASPYYHGFSDPESILGSDEESDSHWQDVREAYFHGITDTESAPGSSDEQTSDENEPNNEQFSDEDSSRWKHTSCDNVSSDTQISLEDTSNNIQYLGPYISPTPSPPALPARTPSPSPIPTQPTPTTSLARSLSRRLSLSFPSFSASSSSSSSSSSPDPDESPTKKRRVGNNNNATTLHLLLSSVPAKLPAEPGLPSLEEGDDGLFFG
ncbi:hypothetical protein K491DRAFT_731022 [Lophiostoma macrostomum CBS 122681]|uniref:Uncharacterized protein n=1 Tax=Lophiostoma macrostomum CBS 122681 TaxID=1314788 RepID=A0A6A6TL02_9PLEO|nr:hypothetical protein K491DRAFT_731022 [Lophiostoma macrostomum CBS 122681]